MASESSDLIGLIIEVLSAESMLSQFLVVSF